MGLLDLLEWWGEDGTSHGNWIVVNEEGLEEGNVELATGLVRDCLVVLPWVGGEVKVLTEALGTETEFSSTVSQSVLNPSSLKLDGVAAVADLGSVEQAVGGEIDEALFFGVEPLLLFGELGVEFTGESLALGEHFVDEVGD